jgi:hypothetical protein
MAHRHRPAKEQAMSLSTSSASPDRYDPLARPAMEAAMAWHGWGSPVGISILLVAVGIAAVLLRSAILGVPIT